VKRVPKWLLPTLSEVLASSDPTRILSNSGQANSNTLDSVNSKNSEFETSPSQQGSSPTLRQLRAEREWYGAIAALNIILQQSLNEPDVMASTIDVNGESIRQGIVISGPAPVLSQPNVVQHISTWTLAAHSIHSPNWMAFQLLPVDKTTVATPNTPPVLPLLPGDPLAAEQFCLVLTPRFSLIMVLGETLSGDPAFLFSFTPEVVQHAWGAIRPRILLMNSQQVDHLDDLIQHFPPVTPDYKTVMQFSRLMLEQMPDELPGTQWEKDAYSNGESRKTESQGTTINGNGFKSPCRHSKAANAQPVLQEVVHTSSSTAERLDVELVQAIAHEVRTPLTTIRTLTRSLLKRTDLPPDVMRRLGIIDRECSEQIDRFGLIFRAVELETSAAQPASMSLIRTSLAEVFQQSIPRWQQQASQRQMTLDVTLPQRMPTVVSDPTVLDQALTSLIERFTRNLPAGSHIQVEVTLAGNQLKLQLQSQPEEKENGWDSFAHSAQSLPKALGQLLTFQPETGCLSLNLTVTKNLFQAIGGKLIVKQRPRQGEVMTVYLPLEVGGSSILESNNVITV
jgi:nitrogen-specific signal transduction histidine kinase